MRLMVEAEDRWRGRVSSARNFSKRRTFPSPTFPNTSSEPTDTVVWVVFCAPSKAEFVELAEELGLYELAVEDALGPHQRPKLNQHRER